MQGVIAQSQGRPFVNCLTSGCGNRPDPHSRWPEYCSGCNAKYATGPICRTPECGYPVVPEDVIFWTERAREEVPTFWHAEFTAEGNPATPEGLCVECAGEWLSNLDNFRDENRCGGYCTPYDHCLQCLLPESEL